MIIHHYIGRFRKLGNVIILIATVVFISLLYPDVVKFRYEFQKGQIWRHEDLVAPFDFPILKSEQETEADKVFVIQNFSPYYRLQPDFISAKRKDLKVLIELEKDEINAAIQASFPGKTPEEAISDAYRFLEMIYKRGVIEISAEHQQKGSDFVINLVEGNLIQKRTLGGFFTLADIRRILAEDAKQTTPRWPDPIRSALGTVIGANITYDAELSGKMLDQQLALVADAKGIVRQGEIIVRKGGVITDDVYDRLVSFRQKFEKEIVGEKSILAVYVGYLMLTILLTGVFVMYVNAYRREILYQSNYLVFSLLWLVAFCYLTYIVERTGVVSVYVVPFCIVPIVVKHFFTYRLAFFLHVIVVLMAGFFTNEGFPFIFTQVVAGVIAVLAVADTRNWSKFFNSVLYILLAYVISSFALSLIGEGQWKALDVHLLGWQMLNVLLILLAFPLIPLMERLFGFTSAISLVELSDLGRPLLRELALKAPGTFQHSIQVANLSEAAAQEIGADTLLVRVGAMYHDIGKVLNSEYFIENQAGRNPHENLSPLESARIIIRHVTEGEQLARKNNLPQIIIRFIVTHHGTTQTDYFYKIWRQHHPESPESISEFTYPGPRPQTREEAILMMADSIEATSRTLKNPSGEDIDNLVEKIIQRKIDKHQLEESKLTFRDLAACKSVFKQMLRSIHHVRVEYPE